MTSKPLGASPSQSQSIPSSRNGSVDVSVLVPGSPRWLTVFGDAPLAHALSSGGSLASRSRAAFFAVDTASLVGTTDAPTDHTPSRLAAFIDEQAPPLAFGSTKTAVRYGSFGLLRWSNGKISELACLLRAAQQWLAEQGAEAIVGPMDFSIFHGYRVMSSGFDTPPFLGEVPRHPGLREALEQCGLSPLSTWRTYDFSAEDHVAQAQLMSQKLEAFRDTLQEYTVQPVNCDTAESTARELALLYPLIMESFSKNFATTHLDFENFAALFTPLAPLICRESSIRIMHGDTCVGFSISYLNPVVPGTVVWHSFGNTAAHRGRGLGYLCIERTFAGFVKMNYSASCCALVKDGPNHFEHTHHAARSYHIMGRRIRS